MRPCRDYWQSLMERLDARLPAPGASEPFDEGDAELSAHLNQCADCREAWAKSRALLQALEILPSKAPTISADFTDRTLKLWEAEKAGSNERTLKFNGRRSRIGLWVGLAAAAALAVTVSLNRTPPAPPNAPQPAPIVASTANDQPPLDRAVVGAGTATLDLAKETSGPVFRVGQRMFRSASFPQLPALALPTANFTPAAATTVSPSKEPEPKSKSEAGSVPESARRVFQLLRRSKT